MSAQTTQFSSIEGRAQSDRTTAIWGPITLAGMALFVAFGIGSRITPTEMWTAFGLVFATFGSIAVVEPIAHYPILGRCRCRRAPRLRRRSPRPDPDELRDGHRRGHHRCGRLAGPQAHQQPRGTHAVRRSLTHPEPNPERSPHDTVRHHRHPHPRRRHRGPGASSPTAGTLPDGSTAPTMHGCGHDTHIAAALAAAYLTEHRDGWHGTAVLLFQPGEETAWGAKAMVDDGLWDRAPRPEVVLAQHVTPLEAGSSGCAAGTWRTSATRGGSRSAAARPALAVLLKYLGS